MISEERIRDGLNNTLESTALEGIGDREEGKVRDSYRQEGQRVLVTTDRISAFDRVLGTIPFKGQVLNQLAAFWFEKTKDIVPNHVISVPDPNVMVVKECEQLPLEFVVRGYITGVTKTSAWYNYQQGVRNFCGNLLPEGLKKNQKFEQPILTPTTKLEKHDRPISRDEAIDEGLIDADAFDTVAGICFKLFERGVAHAASHGLILVDTKYEIGRSNGDFTVSDEIHTPDSSRYWFADTYEELFAAGEDQRKLDKEYVREWLAAQGFRGDGDPPVLTDEVRTEAAKRYIQAYEVITGRDFDVTDEPIQDRIRKALRA
jgi:phosphoribosylaminoimidazole-succinocarboxamide synthase